MSGFYSWALNGITGSSHSLGSLLLLLLFLVVVVNQRALKSADLTGVWMGREVQMFGMMVNPAHCPDVLFESDDQFELCYRLKHVSSTQHLLPLTMFTDDFHSFISTDR